MSADTWCSNVFGLLNSSVHCLGRIESVWLYTTGLSGILSTIAASGAFAYVLRNAYRSRVKNGRWPDLRTKPMVVYLLSLFLADLVHAIADILSLVWVSEGYVHTGNICTAQGILILVGANSIAGSTLAITLHTMSVMVFKRGTYSGLFAMFVVAVIWAYIILFNIILVGTHENLSDLYAPTPSWCGIANHHIGYKIAGEYLWLWLALAVSFIIYVPLTCFNREYIPSLSDKWEDGRRTSLDRPRRRLLYAMIAYPVIYSAIVLPFSIVRWHELTHGATGLVSMLSTKAIWGLSGVLDVSVFLLTRPTALSFDQPSMYGGPPTSSFEVPSGDRLDEGGSVGNQMGDGVARSGA